MNCDYCEQPITENQLVKKDDYHLHLNCLGDFTSILAIVNWKKIHPDYQHPDCNADAPLNVLIAYFRMKTNTGGLKN